jgi:hypothetical protein
VADGAHGTALDECRLTLEDATEHGWTLSGAAAGSEFRVNIPRGHRVVRGPDQVDRPAAGRLPAR